MNQDNQGLDFSTVIASTVHDLKNSLSALIQSHNQWMQRLPEELRGGAEQGVMEHEFRHLNGMLVQLLGLYKLGVNQLPVCPDYHELDDFIEAQLVAHEEVLKHKDILATWRIDTDNPLGFFDRELVASVIANVITNATRFAAHALLITIEEADNQLASTGLGLYFAARIAALHESGGVRGRIEISNGGALGGGLFRLFLP